ncbi:MAG: DNA recombination protein RmuC [Clostridiales bacterium]|nr:DNA recombination protein RmuC [Clostridiales bacterium]MDD6389983.1 DNA recombination protein RmuC [Bacillota bacterium]
MEIMIIALLSVCAVLLILVLVRVSSAGKGESALRIENMHQFKMMNEMISDELRNQAEAQDRRLAELNTRFSSFAVENEQKLEQIRNTTEKRISGLTEENSRQLDRMRQTVDEKLQSTLEERIGQSFRLVSERLEEVYKGLGKMQSLADGVGDLKKVLSNVKTRGVVGEIQLSAILEQVLSPDQYVENAATKAGSQDRVEFAICLPGDGETCVYLPVDAKFPADRYSALVDAYESGSRDEIERCARALEKALKDSAKTIHMKYVDPPHTTDFAIMFLPFEGLYAEALRMGLVDVLQREYRISIAGPTTMAALLNSLQMGFRTLAIEKHSSEVWEVLGAVKTEFDKFENTLKKAQEKLSQAGSELDLLIGTRTNVMKRKLRSVEALSEDRAADILRSDYEEN